MDGLSLLARRELSEAQVRDRLARRGHSADAIDEAIAEARAMAERAIDAPPASTVPLDATIHVVHGRERIASTEDGGIDGLCQAFESWVTLLEREASEAASHA